MIFPIWISGLCLLLRVGRPLPLFFRSETSSFEVQIEPSDQIAFSVISSSTRVVVVPEFRPSGIEAPTLPVTPSSETSLGNVVRSIGTYVCSSLPNSPLSFFHETEKRTLPTCQLALLPGRHRRVFRVEIDPRNPTTVRINRSDWSSDDETVWPSLFVVKVMIYRSSKEIRALEPSNIPERLPKILFLLVELTNDHICRKKHIRFGASFAQANGLRATDKCLVSNTTRRPRTHAHIELISPHWHGPTLLLQHYFQHWIRDVSKAAQPILLTDGLVIQLQNNDYFLRLTSPDEPMHVDGSPMYVALTDENLGQHTLASEENKEWKWSEIDTFRSTPIIEPFLSERKQPLASMHNIDRLLQILDFQFQLERPSSSLLKNVLVTGRSGSGKKTIVGECCQRLWTKHLIYYRLVDCLTFKGNRGSTTLSHAVMMVRKEVGEYHHFAQSNHR